MFERFSRKLEIHFICSGSDLSFQLDFQFNSLDVLSIFCFIGAEKPEKNIGQDFRLPLSSELSQINRKLFGIVFAETMKKNTPERMRSENCKFFFFRRQLIQFLSQLLRSGRKKVTHKIPLSLFSSRWQCFCFRYESIRFKTFKCLPRSAISQLVLSSEPFAKAPQSGDEWHFKLSGLDKCMQNRLRLKWQSVVEMY